MDTVAFEERVDEIDSYIKLLEAIERSAQHGPPAIDGEVVTTRQQRMLYSAVFLQLYNLVEATATWCVSAVTAATTSSGAWTVAQLEPLVRKEWVRTTARTHVILNPDNRHTTSSTFCDLLLQGGNISAWDIEKGGGGNWDIAEIEAISNRIGCVLRISPDVYRAAKRHFRDEKNSLLYIKDLRNQLAHGSISFEQSGENLTVSDLKELKKRTVNYLEEVVQSFSAYVSSFMFLEASARPGEGDS
ncbi:MAG: MAE_28990/MAE_18760 family HEPN-like nuclease [Cyanobacteria bacterium P01_F01_bin.150]